jgi:hypothetical protein
MLRTRAGLALAAAACAAWLATASAEGGAAGRPPLPFGSPDGFRIDKRALRAAGASSALVDASRSCVPSR